MDILVPVTPDVRSPPGGESRLRDLTAQG